MAWLSAFTQALLLPLLLLFSSSLAIESHLHPHPYPLQQQQLDVDSSDVTFRPATEMDLDDITTVVFEAFAPSQLYQYAFPHLDQFKEYHWRCMRKVVGHEFAKLGKWSFINIISVPTSLGPVRTQDRRRDRVVAAAGWQVITSHATSDKSRDMELFNMYHSIAKCSEHIDTNMTRALDFSRQFSLAEKHYVKDYPQKQMYLATLATHPDWDGHGFGAMHCHWGMEKAKAMGIRNTLIATPAGWPLYDSLGFESVANITIKTLDWPEDLWYEYMQYES